MGLLAAQTHLDALVEALDKQGRDAGEDGIALRVAALVARVRDGGDGPAGPPEELELVAEVDGVVEEEPLVEAVESVERRVGEDALGCAIPAAAETIEVEVAAGDKLTGGGRGPGREEDFVAVLLLGVGGRRLSGRAWLAATGRP